MAAKSESMITAKRNCAKKVSKPLMEKKRRARINQCLNQLKNLLETIYFNNIRKRKLEKADILELTVKHLRNLQNTERGTSEYQAGYRNCLAGVSLYLKSDRDSHSTMTQLSSRFSGSEVLHFSTADSDATSSLPQTPVSYPSTHQTSDRYYCSLPKRTEICDIDRISINAQAGAFESKKLKTRHVSLKNANVDERFRILGALKHNYWRPW